MSSDDPELAEEEEAGEEEEEATDLSSRCVDRSIVAIMACCVTRL